MAHRSEHDSPEPLESQIAELARAYVQALIAGDESAAEVVMREAMDAGLRSAEIDEKLIAPALWRVGEMWERGQLSVAEEHLATEITLRVLALQREAQRVAQARPHHCVMLATSPGEQHIVALRMVGNLLQEAGYHVLMLGAEVPSRSLGEAADRHEVDVICMSSTLRGRNHETLRSIDEIRDRRPSARFVIGGRGLRGEEDLRHEVHACERVSEAVEVVDAAVKRARLN
jgi:methanogenic corrinoid protein MtbC1